MIDLAEIEAARQRIAGAAIRTPLVRLYTSDAPAEIYLKLETLQPINSFKIRGGDERDPERVRARAGGRVGDGQRRQHGAGRRVGCARARPARDDRRPRARPRGEARRDRAAGRPRLEAALRRMVERDRHPPRRRRRGLFIHPVEDERGDGRQRHDRPRDPRGPARSRRRRDPLRRRRPDGRHRERAAGPAAADARSTRRSPRPERRSWRRSSRGGPETVEYRPRSSTAPAAAGCSTRCGRW